MSSATPLTDAINALTTYANETTGASDTDLSSAVASLVAGYGSGSSVDYLNYCTAIKFRENFPSDTPDITLALCTDCSELFFTTSGKYTNIKVTFQSQPTTLYALARCYSQSDYLTSITINGDLSKVTRYADMVTNNRSLVEIKGTPLNFTSVTNASYSTWGGNSSRLLNNLTYVRYAENTLHVNHTIYATALDDDSLVSIANGLQSGSHTLTLQSAIKTRLSGILGTVSSGTYDVFTKDSSGSVTLEGFITSTKGWTIA